MTQESLVRLSEASHILGVSEPALRQWTDEGKIKAFITPGGHRRYSKVELKRFMGSHHKTLGVKDLAVKLEDAAEMHREIARSFLSTAAGQSKLGQESHEQLASLGRQVHKLIIRYISEPSKREEIVRAARNTGSDFGETLARLGLPLTDSVSTFLGNRDPIMEVTARFMRKGESFSRRVIEAMPLVDHVMDEALVSLVAAHQQYRVNHHDKPEGRDQGDINNTSAL